MEGRQREAVIIWQGACGSPPPGGRAHGYKGIDGSAPPRKRNVKGGVTDYALIWVGQRGDSAARTLASSAIVAPNYGAEGG